MNENPWLGCAALLVIILLIAVLVIGGGANLLTDWKQAQADREYARAAAIEAAGRADALRIEARTEQQAQRQADFEHSFIMWTTALALITHDPAAWLAVLLVLGIVCAGWFLFQARQ